MKILGKTWNHQFLRLRSFNSAKLQLLTYLELNEYYDSGTKINPFFKVLWNVIFTDTKWQPPLAWEKNCLLHNEQKISAQVIWEKNRKK